MAARERKGAIGLALALLLTLGLAGAPAQAAEASGGDEGGGSQEAAPVPPGPPRNLTATYGGPHPGDPQYAEIGVVWEASEDSGGEPVRGYALAFGWGGQCPAMAEADDAYVVDEHARPDYTSNIGQYEYGVAYCWKVRAFTDAEGLEAGDWTEPVGLTAER